MPPWKGGGEMIKEVHMAPRRENLWRFNGTISDRAHHFSFITLGVKYCEILQVIIFELTLSVGSAGLLDPPFHRSVPLGKLLPLAGVGGF